MTKQFDIQRCEHDENGDLVCEVKDTYDYEDLSIADSDVEVARVEAGMPKKQESPPDVDLV